MPRVDAVRTVWMMDPSTESRAGSVLPQGTRDTVRHKGMIREEGPDGPQVTPSLITFLGYPHGKRQMRSSGDRARRALWSGGGYEGCSASPKCEHSPGLAWPIAHTANLQSHRVLCCQVSSVSGLLGIFLLGHRRPFLMPLLPMSRQTRHFRGGEKSRTPGGRGRSVQVLYPEHPGVSEERGGRRGPRLGQVQGWLGAPTLSMRMHHFRDEWEGSGHVQRYSSKSQKRVPKAPLWALRG